MALKVLTAEDRRSPKYSKTSILVTGPFGVGKTSLIRTLPSKDVVAIDIEGGLKSIDTWADAPASIPVTSFPDFQDLVALIAGPDPSAPANGFHGQSHYEHVRKTYGGTPVAEYATRPIIFCDSISVLTRLAFKYAQQRPEAFSEKTGKPDTRGAYGLLGREVINALQHLQNTPGKTIIFACLLNKITDDYGRQEWVPQMEGSKVGRELPGIVDQVCTMHHFARAEDGSYVLDETAEERRLVCRRANPYSVPAKERSRGVGVTEAPDLGALLTKINSIE